MRSARPQWIPPRRGRLHQRRRWFTERRTRQPLHKFGQQRALGLADGDDHGHRVVGIRLGMNGQVITRPVFAAR